MARNSPDLRPIREPVQIPEPGSDVGTALRNLMQTLRQCVDGAIRSAGLDLSFAHGMVLKTLAREPGMSGAQLARRTCVTAQSMNGLLHSMESTGLIVREKHPENRRVDCWFMTRGGLRQFEQAGEIIHGIIAHMLAQISKADAARLSELLQECASALQEIAETKTDQRASRSSAPSMRAR